MAITRVSVGSFSDVFNAANTPTAGTFQINDFVFLFTGEYIGSDTISTPAGWTLCSPNNNAKQCALFGIQSLTGNESMPTLNWGVQWSWAVVVVYRGLQSLIPTQSGDRNTNSTQFITGPASTITPGQDNSLVIFFGCKTKTTTSNGATYGTLPSGFSLVTSDVPNGSRPAPMICENIQTSATAIPTNSSVKASIADGTNQASQGIIMVFAPALPPCGFQCL